ncbi:TPA: hypothetical protein DEO28_04870 [Candidatus Dependentiae bacterium]|nr:MAG: Sua5/YciO/YrdC/YwlC family protein [candidate division TM6 bacterium GW2011_GWE2_31_21]KKP53884.1 MAG: Sua5/YciO/YrdC/YwlC family protein [candidate division TM6 bacterium GW2011_GWF2_33_332]HBS47664.1 hypothetical protein [Candidatus Dependentiae bacterium]HBZ73813.1 hypothetical protein [Candidatus Dependentiae bacterium]
MHKNLLFWQKSDDILKLTTSLKHNEISIVTTDTILGFLGQISQEAFEKLNAIKEERNDKPYLILIASPSQIFNFVDKITVNKQLLNLINKCWPGPLTIIFKGKSDLPSFLKSKANTIAIRCPKHEGLNQILQEFDGLFSTSANKSGKPAPTKFEKIEPLIINEIKYLVDDLNVTKQNDTLNLPSTIIDCSEGNYVKVVRKGSYTISELEKIYGNKFENYE